MTGTDAGKARIIWRIFNFIHHNHVLVALDGHLKFTQIDGRRGCVAAELNIEFVRLRNCIVNLSDDREAELVWALNQHRSDRAKPCRRLTTDLAVRGDEFYNKAIVGCKNQRWKCELVRLNIDEELGRVAVGARVPLDVDLCRGWLSLRHIEAAIRLLDDSHVSLSVTYSVRYLNRVIMRALVGWSDPRAVAVTDLKVLTIDGDTCWAVQ